MRASHSRVLNVISPQPKAHTLVLTPPTATPTAIANYGSLQVYSAVAESGALSQSVRLLSVRPARARRGRRAARGTRADANRSDRATAPNECESRVALNPNPAALM